MYKEGYGYSRQKDGTWQCRPWKIGINSIAAAKMGKSPNGVWLDCYTKTVIYSWIYHGDAWTAEEALAYAAGAPIVRTKVACECGAFKAFNATKGPAHSTWCPEYDDAVKESDEHQLISKVRAARKGMTS